MWPPVVSLPAWTAAGPLWAVSCPVGCLGVQTADSPGGLSSRAVPAACPVVKALSTSLLAGTRSPTQAPRASLSPPWSRPFGGPGSFGQGLVSETEIWVQSVLVAIRMPVFPGPLRREGGQARVHVGTRLCTCTGVRGHSSMPTPPAPPHLCGVRLPPSFHVCTSCPRSENPDPDNINVRLTCVKGHRPPRSRKSAHNL